MFTRLSFGWDLAKQSLRVLRDDKRLIVFPILSGIASVIVLASFAIPLWGSSQIQALMDDRQMPDDVASYVVLFLFYFINYFVIVFFNSAMIACVIHRFRGGTPSVGFGLRVAMVRIAQIAAWAFVCASVGFVLKIIESRSEKVGQIVSGLMGMAWSIVTYLAVPVLVAENAGPIEAVKRSASLVKKTWGEALTARLGLGIIFFVVMLVALVPLAVLAGLGFAGLSGGHTALGILAIALAVVVFIITCLVSSALNTILLAAVYTYAVDGTVPGGFEPRLIENAFQRK